MVWISTQGQGELLIATGKAEASLVGKGKVQVNLINKNNPTEVVGNGSHRAG